FVTFVSRSSLQSEPVLAEIDHAHWAHINKKRPERLIPVLLEPGVDPPTLLGRFSRYRLTDPIVGMQGLIAEVLGRLVPPISPNAAPEVPTTTKKSAGGIIIPDTAKEKPQQGKVVAVGKAKLNEDGKVIPSELSGSWTILDVVQEPAPESQPPAAEPPHRVH